MTDRIVSQPKADETPVAESPTSRHLSNMHSHPDFSAGSGREQGKLRFRAWLAALLVIASVISATAVEFPLRVDSNGRHLVDQQDKPFLIQGDAAWCGLGGASSNDFNLYFTNRRTNRFNTVIIGAIMKLTSVRDGSALNYYGEPPFLSGYDFAQPNPRYFEYLDFVIRQAETNDMLVLLAPCYIGFNSSQGWQDEVVANGVTKCYAFGRYLGLRYQNFPNVLWVNWGDNSDTNNYAQYVNAIASGIAETATNHLHTAKGWPQDSSRDFVFQPWLTVNSSYAYGTFGQWTEHVWQAVLDDYNRTPVMPTFLIESTYENEHNSIPLWIRRQAYWANLSGAAGQCIGNYPIWAFAEGWTDQLSSAASTSMRYLKNLFDSRPWWTLVPDQNHETLIGGYDGSTAAEYVTAARHAEGSTFIAYLPTPRTVTLDMSRISGTQAKAWWFNPRNGMAIVIGTFDTTGSRPFTPPGADDWVLVVDNATLLYPPPGAAQSGPTPPTALRIVQ